MASYVPDQGHCFSCKVLNDTFISYAGMDEIAVESKVKSIKSSAAFDVIEKLKKQDGKETMSNSVEMDKTNLQGSPTNSRDVPAKNRIRGKVKEFVKIFNQEASNKPKVNVDSQNRSSRWKERGKSKTEDYASVTSTKVNEKMHLPNVKNKNTPVASIVVLSLWRFLFCLLLYYQFLLSECQKYPEEF